MGFQKTGGGEKDAVSVHDFSGFADEERAVSVAVESHAQSPFLCDDTLLQPLQMKRAAVGVDVASVGRDVHRNHVRTKRTKQLRAKLVGRAVGAIESDAEAAQLGAGDHPFLQEVKIFGME